MHNRCHYLLLIFQCYKLVEDSSLFSWKSGPWGRCVKRGCGSGGTRSRAVWCLSSEGITVPRNNCLLSQAPLTVDTCFKVCHSKYLKSQWTVGSWSSCIEQDKNSICRNHRGIQTRIVLCTYHEQLIDDSVCELSQRVKPLSTRNCSVSCHSDCVVSDYSSWSSCNNCKSLYRIRHRRVVVSPMNNGRPCPVLTESTICRACRNTIKIKLHPWTPCTAMHIASETYKENSTVTKPHLGFQSRNITCIDIKGHTVHIKECVRRYDLSSIDIYRTCILPVDCKMTNWLSWIPINNSCLGQEGTLHPGYFYRERRVTGIPKGHGKSCPPLRDTFEVASHTRNKCNRYSWVTSEWSKCKISSKQNQYGQICGYGIRSRDVFCVLDINSTNLSPKLRSTGQLVTSEKCTQVYPVTNEICYIPCNQNCVVSEWSNWSECITGHLVRLRRVLQAPTDSGVPCDHLAESRPCRDEVKYQWVISSTSKCMPTNKETQCGLGFIAQNFICYLGAQKVSEKLCYYLHKPATHVTCYILCSNDCVLSPWTQWSECISDGPSDSIYPYRQRVRSVKAKAGKGAKPCPSDYNNFVEYSKCLESKQFTYYWRTTNWSACLLYKTSSLCGVGVQGRVVACYRSDDVSVSNTKCSESVKPAQTKKCILHCPKDCQLTGWSAWSQCVASCRLANEIYYQKRKRMIIQYAESGGTKCPETLHVTRPCSHLPRCTNDVQWVTEQWSDCLAPFQYTGCAKGLRSRSVMCRNKSSNKTLDLDQCLQIYGFIPKMFENCHIGCKDSPGCTFSDWSDFSKCVGGCNGFRIRTRHIKQMSRGNKICLDNTVFPLVEKHPCNCSSFELIPISHWSHCLESDQSQNSRKGEVHNKHDPYVNERTILQKGRQFPNFNLNRQLKRLKRQIFRLKEAYTRIRHFPKKFQLINANSTSSQKIRLNLPSTSDLGFNFNNSKMHRRYNEILNATLPAQMDEQKTNKGRCQKGYQVRLLGCRSHTKIIFPARKCTTESHFQYRSCPLLCPQDCVLSQWSQWSACTVTCATGIQVRSRKIVIPSANGGRSCPSRSEALNWRTCNHECISYRWIITGWSPCQIEGNIGHSELDIICGLGIQTTLFKCVRHINNIQQSVVKNGQCLKSKINYGRRQCYLPCPGECVLSDWSDWSTCLLPCGSNSSVRNRVILRKPKNESECGSLNESVTCIEGHNCYSFLWLPSVWSSCNLDDGQTCGFGLKTRYLKCVNSSGQITDPSFCFRQFGPALVPVESMCEVPCPVDCVMSEWTLWSDCSTTCGLGSHIRWRRVLKRSRNGGTKCSSFSLTQKKPCYENTCFDVVVSNWSQCLNKNFCGVGHQTRTLKCVTSNGLTVNMSFCHLQWHHILTQTERECFMPCPRRCLRTSWSEWSDCHVNCKDITKGDEHRGTQVKSRGIIALYGSLNSCGPEYSSRTCLTKTCYTFHWVRARANDHQNYVWCERSDGLSVLGGCSEIIKPFSNSICHSSCLDNNSFKDKRSGKCDAVDVSKLVGVSVVNCTKVYTTFSSGVSKNIPKSAKSDIWIYAIILTSIVVVLFLTSTSCVICCRRVSRDSHKNYHITIQDPKAGELELLEQYNNLLVKPPPDISLASANKSELVVDCKGHNGLLIHCNGIISPNHGESTVIL